MKFEFIDVQWLHSFKDEPTRIVSQLDALRKEIRKLEFFRSGIVGYAYDKHATHGTILGTVPIPSLSEINADPQFAGVLMFESEFEALWSRYVF